MQLGAGKTLKKGKYLLNHVLDQQGIGWTYRATHTSLNQSVIIKTLNPVFRSHPEYSRMCEEFETRSQQWARSHHPARVKVLDFFYEGTMPQAMPFVVMESVVGTSLSDRLRSETLSEADIISLLRQLASALTQAQGLVHGNLRPRNIIRRSGSQDCVLVGSALSLMPSLFERSALQNPYAAPELSHGKVTSSSDLYSLGAILYTCLSGHSPTLATPDAPLSDRLPLLSLLKPGAIRLLRSAMASMPHERPATADGWLALLSSRSTHPAPATPTATLPVIPVAPILPAIATPEPFPPYRTEALTPESGSAMASPMSPMGLPIATPIATPIVQPAVPIVQSIELPVFQTQPNPPPSVSSDSPQSPSPIQPIQRAEFRPNPVIRAPQKSSFMTLLPSVRSLKRTAGLAAIGGILFGLVLRFHAAQRPGASLFHTGQSFPARDWKGTIDPPKDDLDNIPIEAPGSRPNSSRSTEPDSALTPTPEKSSDKPIDNTAESETPSSIAPSQNRRPANPSELPPDPGSSDFSSTPSPDQPNRSIVPDFPLQRDPESVTDPGTDPDPAPESPTAPRSTPRTNPPLKNGR